MTKTLYSIFFKIGKIDRKIEKQIDWKYLQQILLFQKNFRNRQIIRQELKKIKLNKTKKTKKT